MKTETATIYVAECRRSGRRRRYFTPKAAAKAEAVGRYFAKHPCECEAETNYNCGCRGDKAHAIRTRLARWILRGFKERKADSRQSPA